MGKKRLQQRLLSEREDDSDVVSVTDDAVLLKKIEAAFAAMGYSPAAKIRSILTNCHTEMQRLTRATASVMLADQKLSELDKAVTNSNINANDAKWVANVRHLTENLVIHQQLIDTMTAIHQRLPRGSDAEREVWSILKGPRTQMINAEMAAKMQATMTAQSQISGGPGSSYQPNTP